jgi:hypothetical protein
VCRDNSVRTVSFKLNRGNDVPAANIVNIRGIVSHLRPSRSLVYSYRFPCPQWMRACLIGMARRVGSKRPTCWPEKGVCGLHNENLELREHIPEVNRYTCVAPGRYCEYRTQIEEILLTLPCKPDTRLLRELFHGALTVRRP